MKIAFIKNIFVLCALLFALSSCNKNEPYDTQSPDDQPRILIPYETKTGKLEYLDWDPTIRFVDSVVVTPSRYTTVNWYLNEELACTGLKIDTLLAPGAYKLLIEAVTTAGKRTTREGRITVKDFPSDDPEPVDPQDPTMTEVDIFTTPTIILWNADLLRLTSEMMANVPAGATVLVYFEFPPAGDEHYNETQADGSIIYKEYHALRVVTPSWDENPDYISQVDMSTMSNPFTFVYTERMKNMLDESNPMCFVGWGVQINKIVYLASDN